jgi:hypothetical protein
LSSLELRCAFPAIVAAEPYMLFDSVPSEAFVGVGEFAVPFTVTVLRGRKSDGATEVSKKSSSKL